MNVHYVIEGKFSVLFDVSVQGFLLNNLIKIVGIFNILTSAESNIQRRNSPHYLHQQ